MRADISRGRPQVEYMAEWGQWVVRFHDRQQDHGRTVILAVMSRSHRRKARVIAAQYLGCRPTEIDTK